MSGIFGLSAYNDRNLAGLIPDKTRESYREYGYFGGGSTSPGLPSTSTVDRIDYSSDTATANVRGPLSLSRLSSESTGNSNFGYFGSGNPGPLSRVDRIDYSNDTATASVRGPLSQAKHSSSASGNSNFGWFTGGHTNPNTTDINYSISTIDRIDYSNDLSTASIRGNLNQNRTNHSIAGNSNYGWIAGGNRAVNDSAYFTSVERLDYSNDVSLTSFRSTSNDISGQGNSATGNNNFGYHYRGTNPSGLARTQINRIDYSNDLVSPTLRGPLSLFITSRPATGNSNFGYFGGGLLVPAGFTPNSSVERIDYSNDTVISSVRGPLSSAKSSFSATSSHNFGGSPISQYGVFPKPFGYFGGGSPGPVSTVDRIDYSNDTGTALVRNNLSSNKERIVATGNSNFGYFVSNQDLSTTIDRIDYSNDNSSTTHNGFLTFGKGRGAATGNSNFGYFGGGGSSPLGSFSGVDRLNYSNDVGIALLRGPLSSARRYIAATGNSNFGYFAGGIVVSTVDRIDYSNDSATASVRGPLILERLGLAATGNSNFGYYGGGGTPSVRYSTVDRIDYSNDTAQASPRGPLSLERYVLSAAGNSNFGYFGGGANAIPGPVSTVDRIDYSNDSATASVRGPLSSARFGLAATSPLTPSSAFSPDQLIRGTSNTDFQPTSTFFDIQSMRRIEDTTNESVKKRVLGSYGYFAGGNNPSGNLSIIDRVDFSNDLQNASIRNFISNPVRTNGGCGNSNFGYSGGGGFPTVATIDRIDYSNDSAAVSVRGPLSSAKYGICAVGNNNFGYFGGGFTNTLLVQRKDYANDDSNTLNRNLLNVSRYNITTVGNNNFGYFGGGTIPGPVSTVDRIDYSNDSAKALIRGALNEGKSLAGGCGNNNFGYICGGAIPGSISTVERIDYSNDLTLPSIRGPLSSARRYLSGTGTLNFGYLNGSNTSNLERIDFSNDLSSTSLRGNSSSNQNKSASTTNARNS